jgi:hypothetical protein
MKRMTWGVMAGLVAACAMLATVSVMAQRYDRAGARFIAERLYKAILGRDGDAGGLDGATAAIQRGDLNGQIQGMFNSEEFRNGSRNKRAADLVDQFYRGLLGRAPDRSGMDAFLPRVERREYAGVISEMLGSEEFRKVMGAPAGGGSGSGSGGGGGDRLQTALSCQARVLSEVRNAGNGKVFLTFDRMPSVNGDVVQGEGVDRFNNLDRRLTYRCERGNATFSYADRKGPTVVDGREPFPSVAVRNCESSAGGGFGGAALSASDSNTEYVLGLTGGGTKRCTMDRQRVVSVDTIK